MFAKIFIYGKASDMKRFAPLNCSSGCFVRNLIYASSFETLTEARKVCNNLIEDNPGYKFKVVVKSAEMSDIIL